MGGGLNSGGGSGSKGGEASKSVGGFTSPSQSSSGGGSSSSRATGATGTTVSALGTDGNYVSRTFSGSSADRDAQSWKEHMDFMRRSADNSWM
jgi:hypothetical protein